MSDLEKAARQALDALENEWFWPTPQFAIDAIDALRAALAQQQAEPAEQAEPEHWVITAKVGEIVGFRAPNLKKGDKVYPHPQHQCTITAATLACKKPVKQAEPVVCVEALKAIVEFVDGPAEGKRPDVWALLVNKARAALAQQQAEPMVVQADKFCDSNCTMLDHHADCEYGNPSY